MSLYLPVSFAMPGFAFFYQDCMWFSATPRNFLLFQIEGRIAVVRGDENLYAPELNGEVYIILLIDAVLTAAW